MIIIVNWIPVNSNEFEIITFVFGMAGIEELSYSVQKWRLAYAILISNVLNAFKPRRMASHITTSYLKG